MFVPNTPLVIKIVMIGWPLVGWLILAVNIKGLGGFDHFLGSGISASLREWDYRPDCDYMVTIGIYNSLSSRVFYCVMFLAALGCYGFLGPISFVALLNLPEKPYHH